MLPAIFATCQPRAEILSGELKTDLFAAKLRLVVEGNAPQVYQSADLFFANTYPTDGIQTLIREVFSRLTGKGEGNAVIRLETSFGGGKTHDEIALWHICKQGRAIQGLDRFTSLDLIPTIATQVAAVDGRDLDPINGILHTDTGVTTYTLWGEIAYQVGGIAGYQLLQASDRSGISPGTSVMEQLIQGKPTVIVIDEIARHLSAAKAKTIQDSNLAKQVVAFLFSLMDLASACSNLVLVYSLASNSDTFSDETVELKETISASARQERTLSPSSDVEIFNIVKQRLFEHIDASAADSAATEYLTLLRTSQANLPDACKQADYAEAIAQSYPFHPELFSLLTKKIASIPNFQKTRGALRLFAQVVRYLWQYQSNDWIPLIHTHHIPVGIDGDITSDLTSRLERPQMRPPVGADIYSTNGREAFAQNQDREWLAAGKPPFSSWVARTIFLHSLPQGIACGIHRAELNLSLLTPNLEIGFVDRAMERLVAVAWHLDDDPITSRSRFQEEPSINKVVSQEKDRVGRSEAKEDLRSRRNSIFAKKFFTPVFAPDSPSDVDDRSDDIVLCLIDFDDATIAQSIDAPPPLVEQIFGSTGEAGKFRLYRNRLLFLIANKSETERAIGLAKLYRAIKNILASPNLLDDLSESQQKKLRAMEGAADLDVRIALTNAYRHLFYPDQDPIKAPTGLKHYVLPAQDSSTIKGKNNQQETLLKALKDCQKIRTDGELKPYAPAYILQKVWAAGLDRLTTKALREAFAKDLGLKFLIDAELSLLRDTLRQGLTDGQWDMKVGDRLYIKTETGLSSLPNPIEFSDRQELYRRGILQPPEPRVIELAVQVLSSTETTKQVRVSWRAKEAVTVKLFCNGGEILGNFLPKDEYEGEITQTTTFQVVADYGNGETEQKETLLPFHWGCKEPTTPYRSGATNEPVIELKPKILSFEGTVNKTLTSLKDSCTDNKVLGIASLSVAVDAILDYRKLSTSLSLLNRPHYALAIDQTLTLQVQGQFIRFEHQGDAKGFNSFSSPLASLLNSPDVQGNVNLKLTFEFPAAVKPDSSELMVIADALQRNPANRLKLMAEVVY